MTRSHQLFDSDLLDLMTSTLEAVVVAGLMPHIEMDSLRFVAAKHILAAIGAGERDGRRLEHTALAHVRAHFVAGSTPSHAVRLPSVHRSSA